MASIIKIVSKNGEVSYRVRIRLRGHPMLSKTFPNKTMAKEWAQQMEAKIKTGMNLSVLESQKHTLSELIGVYVSNVLSKRDAYTCDTLHKLNEWSKIMGAYNLANITPALIIKKRTEIAESRDPERNKSRSNSTINRYMAALSVVLSYAVRELEWMSNNPASRVSKLPEPRGRIRYLTEEERIALLNSAKQSGNSYLYPIILVAITTGARKMEILNLKWANVRLDDKCAVLEDTKNGESRNLPLVEPALSELKKLYNNRGTNKYVFPSMDGLSHIDIQTSWYKTLNRAGIENFHFHDLRHTCASYLAMNGHSLVEISTILGHKTIQMTKRYSHLSNAHSYNVVAETAQKIFGGII